MRLPRFATKMSRSPNSYGKVYRILWERLLEMETAGRSWNPMNWCPNYPEALCLLLGDAAQWVAYLRTAHGSNPSCPDRMLSITRKISPICMYGALSLIYITSLPRPSSVTSLLITHTPPSFILHTSQLATFTLHLDLSTLVTPSSFQYSYID